MPSAVEFVEVFMRQLSTGVASLAAGVNFLAPDQAAIDRFNHQANSKTS